MYSDIYSENRREILRSCQSLLDSRYHYAQLALLFSAEHINKKDILVSVEDLIVMIDAVINMATRYLDTGEGLEQVDKMLKKVLACSQSLFSLIQQSFPRDGSAPKGIHPNDWEWIKRGQFEKQVM